MRIEGNWPGWRQAYEASRTQIGRPGAERDKAEGAGQALRGSSESGDAVVISEAARELASAPATGAPETREQRIARLREQIAAGTYRVDPERLADRLLARWTDGAAPGTSAVTRGGAAGGTSAATRGGEASGGGAGGEAPSGGESAGSAAASETPASARSREVSGGASGDGAVVGNGAASGQGGIDGGDGA